MKFAMVGTDACAADGEHLLRVMLHHFCRIHAAKSSFRDRFAAVLQIYVSYSNGLRATSLTPSNCVMLRLCCSKRAA
jgi:hypothetical protein